MTQERMWIVGFAMILGAAVGYTVGFILTDPAWAAVYGAAGAGLGIVLGAVGATLTAPGRERRHPSSKEG